MGDGSGHDLWDGPGHDLWGASATDDAAGDGATEADANGGYNGAASRRLWVCAGSGSAAGIWPGHVLWATDGLRAAGSIRGRFHRTHPPSPWSWSWTPWG